MNLTAFCSISQFFFRNLKVLKLQRNLGVNKLVKTPEQIIAVLSGREPINWYYDRNERSEDTKQDEYGRKRDWSECLTPTRTGTLLCGLLSFNFFGKSDEDNETPEDKLITTIKRSILCIQREEYDKAEQMLHLSLRMAQDLQSKEGVTYIFDVMANLAMEREQFKKAEKLFADVIKRLFADGYTEDSPQIMHISAKLAHMAQLQGDLDKAMQGFTWTLKRLEDHIKKMPNDKDIQELFGLTKNWFGQLQMKLGKYVDAKKSFQEAYDCLVGIYGSVNEEAITILNNLSVVCVNLDEFEPAKNYLIEALELVKELKDTTQEGVLQANLGLIYLREGLVTKAKEACSLAWRIGKQSRNANAIEQAEYCLNEIKSFVQ